METENRVLTALSKKALEGGKVFRAQAMKVVRAYSDAEDKLHRQLQFVGTNDCMRRMECTPEVYAIASNKVGPNDRSPGLNVLTDVEFQAYLVKGEDGKDLAVALDILPTIDKRYKRLAAMSGDGPRRSYLFEVDQITGGFRMLEAAHEGSDSQVRSILSALRPLAEIPAGLHFSGGYVSSVSGMRFEVVPA